MKTMEKMEKKAVNLNADVIFNRFFSSFKKSFKEQKI